jgi:hypothetical protein
MAELAFVLVPRRRTVAAKVRGELVPVRLRDEELVAAVQDDLAELLVPQNRVEAAERLVSVASRFLPCRAAIVRHGSLVVAARGEARDLVMTRHPEAQPVLDGETLLLRVGERASLEMCDPLDDEPFESLDRAALRLLGERYAKVLDALGVVTDAAEIARHTLDT